MADEILNVRADAYRACILLDVLPTMTLEKFRKLVRLMTKYPEDNREALEQLGRWLRANWNNSQRTKKMYQIYRNLYR